MKAAVFHSPKKITADTVPDPTIQHDEDVILKVTSTAICGSDLHIYNGFIPQTRPITMGHEFMGIIEDVGKGVTKLKRGDRVVVPFPIACGQCWFCNHLEPGHCENSNPEKYGPEGGIMDEKGELYSAIPIYMVGMMAGRQNMYVYLMPISDHVKFRIPLQMSKYYFLRIYFQRVGLPLTKPNYKVAKL